MSNFAQVDRLDTCLSCKLLQAVRALSIRHFYHVACFYQAGGECISYVSCANDSNYFAFHFKILFNGGKLIYIQTYFYYQ